MKMNVEHYQMDHDDDMRNVLMNHDIHWNDYHLDLNDVQEDLIHFDHHIHVDDDLMLLKVHYSGYLLDYYLM
jgi:hypothetical protein